MALQRLSTLPFFFLLLLQLLLSCHLKLVSPSSTSPMMARPGCQDRCGDIQLPYPFGVGSGCYKDASFAVHCNETFTPPRAYLIKVGDGRTEIIGNITVSEAQIRIRNPNGFLWMCFNKFRQVTTQNMGLLSLGGTSYSFSDTRNVFTVIGCYIYALISVWGDGGNGTLTGCASTCSHVWPERKNPRLGMGSCQAPVPSGLNEYNVSFKHIGSLSTIQESIPCLYCFMAENESYAFSPSDLRDSDFIEKHRDGFPMVLEWVVGRETCELAQLNKSSYACASNNSKCHDSTNRSGYFCTCADGYKGNPYFSDPDGCQDINECEDACIGGTCLNLPGTYRCDCPKGTELDPTTKTCQKKAKRPFPTSAVSLGLSVGLLLFMLGSWMYWGLQKRRLMISRQRLFEQNGGLLLKRQMPLSSGARFKIYTMEELERATNKFDKKMILGQGGHGTVYKGNLDNGDQVAIKKSKIIDERQRNEFAKEMLILSQINHRNVVTLLGCCLEVEVPMLVYEFISNGTLFHHIHREIDRHRESDRFSISFVERLRIAVEAAQAFNYLHVEASTPIVHGDVKSANILLGDQLTVKISDFGASRLTPMDKAQFTTLVQGTFGYLDPESLHTHKLTTKSDVYSFGVVLAELLTGMMAVYSDDRSQIKKNLALSFVSSMEDDLILQLLDDKIMNEEENKEYVNDVAKLTCRCLSVKGEERPTMEELAMELQGIRSHLLAQHELYNMNEKETLLGEPSTWYASNTSTHVSSTDN